MSNKSRQWAETALGMIHNQLSGQTHPSGCDLLSCGDVVLEQLLKASDSSTVPPEAHRILERLESISDRSIKTESAEKTAVSLHSRRIYSESRLLHSLLDLRDIDTGYESEKSKEEVCACAVARLDMAIIIAGAPGDGRLDLILDTISVIQAEHLPINGDTQYLTESLKPELSPVSSDYLAPNEIPRISPPSIQKFQRISSSPFILPGFINDWPALTDHPWNSAAYLLHVAGRGRVVPVEVGSDYRAEEWFQKIVPWEIFLRGIGMDTESHTKGQDSRSNNDSGEVLYLAQHTLLTQFPALRADIIVPDYVYTSLSPPTTFPGYRPPCNNEQLIINAWLGPEGTLSPAHTDPYFNCYGAYIVASLARFHHNPQAENVAQVVGRKIVWLAPPQFQHEMYPYSNPNAPYTTHNVSTQDNHLPPLTEDAAPSLANTSRVDVFSQPSSDATPFPLFESAVRPNALCAVLQPGDLLYIPPGWWHAMRSVDVSFSVSMWF